MITQYCAACCGTYQPAGPASCSEDTTDLAYNSPRHFVAQVLSTHSVLFHLHFLRPPHEPLRYAALHVVSSSSIHRAWHLPGPCPQLCSSPHSQSLQPAGRSQQTAGPGRPTDSGCQFTYYFDCTSQRALHSTLFTYLPKFPLLSLLTQLWPSTQLSSDNLLP